MGEAHMLREHRLGELQSSRSDPLGDDDDLLLVAGVPHARSKGHPAGEGGT